MNGMDKDLVIAIFVIGGSFIITMLMIVFSVVQRILETKAKETTKRELAAYIAEGTMTPEDAERILRSDVSPRKQKCGD